MHGAGSGPKRRIDPSAGVQTATWSQSVFRSFVMNATLGPSAERAATGALVATVSAASTRSAGGTGGAAGCTGSSRVQPTR